MKKRFLLFLSIILTALSIGLCSCGGVNSYREDKYERPDEYQIGNFTYSTDSIKRIEIEWGPKDVNVLQSTSTTASVSETGTLEDDEKLRYLIDGTKLTIKFWKSGKRSDVKPNTKELTIEVPQGVSLEVDTISGDVNGQDLILNDFEFDSTSGDVKLNKLECQTFTVETVGGETNVKTLLANQSVIDTTSGDVTIYFATIKSIEYDTVSGEGEFTFKKGVGLTVEYDTVSGDFTTSEAYKKTGNIYLIGTGEVYVEAESTSGDLKVNFI